MMSINSPAFLLAFLPLFVLSFVILPRTPKLRLFWLLAGGIVFYSFAGGIYLLLLLGQAVFTYTVARRWLSSDEAPTRRLGLWLGLLNLAPLIILKYLPVLLGGDNELLTGAFAWIAPRSSTRLIPLGISFFTFNLLGYVIDVYQGRVAASRSLVEFTTYATFFPTISSGPLIRFSQFEPDPQTAPSPRWSDTGVGLERLALGLAKKILIADQIGMVINPMLAQYHDLQLVDAWLAVLGYHFQIYYDFSGYTDMAIGVGRLLGIKIPENFDSPYRSASIAEFWRRWHMTLSFWFRDYLFMPLSRALLKSRIRKLRGHARSLGLLVTMILIGLWHGAAWTFALFGAYHGLLLALDPWWKKRVEARVPPWAARAVSTLLIIGGWILFRSQSLAMIASLARSLMGLNGWGLTESFLDPAQHLWYLVLIPMLLLITNLPLSDNRLAARHSTWLGLAIALLLMLALLSLGKPSPFLYYQF